MRQKYKRRFLFKLNNNKIKNTKNQRPTLFSVKNDINASL